MIYVFISNQEYTQFSSLHLHNEVSDSFYNIGLQNKHVFLGGNQRNLMPLRHFFIAKCTMHLKSCNQISFLRNQIQIIKNKKKE